MSSNEFKQGDTVRLNSGGPVMTVQSVEQENISVTWFDNKGHQKKGVFNYREIDHDDGMPPMAIMG